MLAQVWDALANGCCQAQQKENPLRHPRWLLMCLGSLNWVLLVRASSRCYWQESPLRTPQKRFSLSSCHRQEHWHASASFCSIFLATLHFSKKPWPLLGTLRVPTNKNNSLADEDIFNWIVWAKNRRNKTRVPTSRGSGRFHFPPSSWNLGSSLQQEHKSHVYRAHTSSWPWPKPHLPAICCLFQPIRNPCWCHYLVSAPSQVLCLPDSVLLL